MQIALAMLQSVVRFLELIFELTVQIAQLQSAGPVAALVSHFVATPYSARFAPLSYLANTGVSPNP